MTTLFDDIASVISELDDSWLFDSIDACERLDVLQQQFNALVPNWAEAPEWAQWCAIDAGGGQCWHDGEPNVRIGACAWISQDERYIIYQKLNLPLGIDWRLCKWHRPAVRP